MWCLIWVQTVCIGYQQLTLVGKELTLCILVTPKYLLWQSKDPDEMPHNAAFHLGPHCLLRQNWSSEKDRQLLFGNYNL